MQHKSIILIMLFKSLLFSFYFDHEIFQTKKHAENKEFLNTHCTTSLTNFYEYS